MGYLGFKISNLSTTLRNLLSLPQKDPITTTIPPPIDWLLTNRNLKRAQTLGNTPSASLYRMYEYIVLDYNSGLRSEIQNFFNHPHWAISDIPDPQDPDPARYAFLATIPHFLVEAFNRLIRQGLSRDVRAYEAGRRRRRQMMVLEELPPWTDNVPRLEEMVVIPRSDGSEPNEGSRSPRFFMMGLVVEKPSVFFV